MPVTHTTVATLHALSGGYVQLKKSDGTLEEYPNLRLAEARCFELGATSIASQGNFNTLVATRLDTPTCVEKPNGARVYTVHFEGETYTRTTHRIYRYLSLNWNPHSQRPTPCFSASLQGAYKSKTRFCKRQVIIDLNTGKPYDRQIL